MKFVSPFLVCLLALIVLSASPSSIGRKVETRKDFKSIFDKYLVTGSLMIFDDSKNVMYVYNEEESKIAVTPASTFKIMNSLIGLETGVAPNENFTLPWDKKINQNSEWNRDQDMTSAFRNSTVWYYQELARKIGSEKMKLWLDKVQYGNSDISGGIDAFWLNGGLRISPAEQMEFLINLREDKLPFSAATMATVKKIMVDPLVTNYVLSAKTGWGFENGTNIGWYAGYMEIKKKPYYFVNCIKTNDSNNKVFVAARKEMVIMALKKLEIIPKK